MFKENHLAKKMKPSLTKLAACLMAAVMLLGSAAVYAEGEAAQTAPLVYDDFSNFGIAGYSMSDITAFSGKTVQGNDKAMQISAAASVTKEFSAIDSGFAVLSTAYMATETSGKVRLQQVYNTEAGRDRAYEIYCQSGRITLYYNYDGTANDHISVGEYKAGEWNLVTTVLDMANKKIFVFVNGQQINTVPLQFLKDTGAISKLTIVSEAATRKYVDDLYIDRFATKEAAFAAARVLSVNFGSKLDSFTETKAADFMTAAQEALAPLRTAESAEALANVQSLIDAMVPTSLNSTVFNETYEGFADGATISSGYVAAQNVTATLADSGSVVANLNNNTGRARLLKAASSPMTGTYRLSFDFMSTKGSDDKGLVVNRLAGATNNAGNVVNAYQLSTSNACIFLEAGTTTLLTGYSAERWYHFTIEADCVNEKVTVYLDGEPIKTDDFSARFKESGQKIQRVFDTIHEDYRSSAPDRPRGSIYIDNLKLETEAVSLPEVAVASTVMRDANGNAAYTMVPGGSIDSISITKNDSASKMVYTAVYETKNGSPILAGVTASDISSMAQGETKAFNAAITLPQSATGKFTLKHFVAGDDFKPLSEENAMTSDAAGAKIFLAGDSTVADYNNPIWLKGQAEDYYYPQAGWGAQLYHYMNNDVVIDNRAIPGETLKGFYNDGYWNGILNDANPGDYVLIQFAHNDSKVGTGAYVAVDTDYKAWLNYYVQTARAKGLIPVLVTSPMRRVNGRFGGDSILVSYAEAMKSFGRAMNVPVIDLHAMSVDLVTCQNSVDSELVSSMYLILDANDSRYSADERFAGSSYNKAAATTDNTHFTEYGAAMLAGLVAEQFKALNLGIAAQCATTTYVPVAP